MLSYSLTPTNMDKPIHGQLYSLTGGKGQPCIANGNSWAESRIPEEKRPDRFLTQRMAAEFVAGLNKQAVEKLPKGPECLGCGDL
jgi:hypothetical protein